MSPAQHSLKKVVPPPTPDLFPTTPGRLIFMATRGATRVDDNDDVDDDDGDDDDNDVAVVDYDDDSALCVL